MSIARAGLDSAQGDSAHLNSAQPVSHYIVSHPSCKKILQSVVVESQRLSEGPQGSRFAEADRPA